MNKIFKAFAPATVANVICGFDILSFAIGELGDTVEIKLNHTNKLIIKEMINGENLPFDSKRNVCSVVIKAMQNELNIQEGLDIYITKGYNAGSGLGSSAASSAAAAMVYNAFIGNVFSKDELVNFARQGELIACGAAITDNVAAAIYGGMVMVQSSNPLRIVELPILDDLYVHVFFQQVIVNTKEARKILPKLIPMETSVQQSASIASFISSIYTKDYELMKLSLNDYLAAPYRSKLIPNYNELENISKEIGALGFGISGSGPTVFSLTKGRKDAEMIKLKFDSLYKLMDNDIISFISKVGEKGAFIV